MTVRFPRRLTTCCGLMAAAALTTGNVSAQTQPDLARFQIDADRAIGTSGATLMRLDVPLELERPLRVTVPFGGEVYPVDLTPHSIRDPQYKALEQRADGQIYEVKPAQENTLRGRVWGKPGSTAAAGIMPEGLYARVLLEDGSDFWLQPVGDRVPGAPADLYAVYTQQNVVQGDWRCGNEDAAERAETTGGGGGGTVFNDRGATLRVAQLSTDADFEYFNAYGGTGTVNSRIATIINIMNVQYEREVDITHTLSTQLVRTAETDPYGSADSSVLLANFRDDWNANRPGSRGDVAQLFTGKQIIGSVIGRAFLAQVCTNHGYGIVQSDFNGNLMSATDLSSHELGHNWAANHCTCSGNGTTVSTMNPFITSINRFRFSNDINNVAEIVAHRGSRSCLANGSSSVDPRNDLCASAVPIGPGFFGWNNTGANNDGPLACGNIGADIWYAYTAPCDGTVSINTCGSNHDTVLAAYTGGCTALTQIVCNDDAASCGEAVPRDSDISFPVTRGTTYRIRVGGFSGAVGDGLLSLSQAACPTPTNNSCVNATNMNHGTRSFSTIGATTDGPVDTFRCDNAGNAQLLNDVWFVHVARCAGTVRLSTCGADFDSRLAVYLGCSTGPNTAIACNDDNGPACAGTRSSLDFTTTPGTSYLIRVGGYNGQVGSGILFLTALTCPPPANDGCFAAAPLSGTSGSAIAGTAVGAYNDGAATCGSSTTGPDVWYAYTAPSDGALTVTTCGTHDIAGIDTGMDSVLSLHSACPGTAANQLTDACNDDSSFCGSFFDVGAIRDSAVSANLSAGQTVLIRVGTFGNALPSRPFSLNFFFTPGVGGSGACCCGSTCSLTSAAACTGSNTSFSGAGTVCNPAGNATAPCCKSDYNQSGGAATVQDIFDFLNGYFGSNTCADFNGGGVTVQDIFDFLNTYFAGGCS